MCRACCTKPTCQRYLISQGIKKSRCKVFCEFTANAELPALEYDREARASSLASFTAWVGWIPRTGIFICWKHLPKRYPPTSCTLCSITAASPQCHRSSTTVSPQCHLSSTAAPPQHHHVTSAAPQHHHNATTTSPQQHRSITATSPQQHRGSTVAAPQRLSPCPLHSPCLRGARCADFSDFLLLDLSPLYKCMLYVFIRYALYIYV